MVKRNLVKHQKVSKYYENDCRLAWRATLKKTKVKLSLFTDIGMILMLKIEEEYVTPLIKYIKNYDKNKELSYLKCWDVNNLHVYEMSQKLFANGFK